MTEQVPSKNVLSTLRDLRHVAEASGRTVSLSADNILDVLGEIEGRDKRISTLERQVDELSIHASKWVTRALQLQQRATPEPPAEESDWIIDYADVDRRPEYFSGFGAEAAARRRFEQAQQQWTCRLFRRVDRSNYGTTQPPGVNVQGASLDRLGWICSMCHGWNRAGVVTCQHAHSGSTSTKRTGRCPHGYELANLDDGTDTCSGCSPEGERDE